MEQQNVATDYQSPLQYLIKDVHEMFAPARTQRLSKEVLHKEWFEGVS